MVWLQKESDYIRMQFKLENTSRRMCDMRDSENKEKIILFGAGKRGYEIWDYLVSHGNVA